jgi:transcriptional regulator
MYLPRRFREDDPEILAEFMRRYSFAALVTAPDGAPFVSHLPLLYDPARGTRGAILGHMARANPQWRHFEAGREILAIFQGPHAYVSPSWYSEDEPHVPTWNYTAVHAYGAPKLLDEAATRALLEALIAANESGRERPWRFDGPEEFLRDRLKEIVGFEIELTRVEGKFKLSQNRLPDDQRRVHEQLAASGHPDDAALARYMKMVQERG